MAWNKGFDFRGTAAYVTDPTDCTYVLPTDAYPTTRNGCTFGWVTDGNPLPSSGENRSTSVDHRLAGYHVVDYFCHFQVDYPAASTSYVAHIAYGGSDALNSVNLQTGPDENGNTMYLCGGIMQGYDKPRDYCGINPYVTAYPPHFLDVNGNDRTVSTWPTSETGKTLSLQGAFLDFQFTSGQRWYYEYGAGYECYLSCFMLVSHIYISNANVGGGFLAAWASGSNQVLGGLSNVS